MKVSFISTVYNEEKTIKRFIDSLLAQSKKPDEIIVVDAYSTDKTFAILQEYKSKIKIYQKKGNRSVGRNEAINRASFAIIACSDAGCILKDDWLEEITKPFRASDVDLVAGYYKGLAKNVFQKCLIPFVLVMPDNINSTSFLPSTRSVAFKKIVWKEVGGFNEAYSHNEDYVFAKSLVRLKKNLLFNNEAIVSWIPRENLSQAFNMLFRFAKGDAEAKIFRHKVVLVFLRYVSGLLLLLLYILTDNYLYMYLIVLLLILYGAWSIAKNYKYVRKYQALLYLPALQITSDIAVQTGTLVGILRPVKKANFFYLSLRK